VRRGGREGEHALSHSTHTYTHIYTYTQVACVCRGEEGVSLMLYHLRVGGECRIDSCMDASVQIYECVSELLN